MNARIPEQYLGVMSGTSQDGLDIVLAEIAPPSASFQARVVAFEFLPFPADFRRSLLTLLRAEVLAPAEILGAHVVLGRFIGCAVAEFLASHKIQASTVTALGLHGPTFQHRPEGTAALGQSASGSWQLGDPHSVQLLTGVPTISDFRAADMALGGSGAPLVPFLDRLVFSHPSETRILLNLGGIANLTLLRPGLPVVAFDTGPANMIIDSLMRRHPDHPADWDEQGVCAASGKPIPRLLDQLLDLPYFALRPPKSTGRELFGEAFTNTYFQVKAPFNDLVATATSLTTRTIHDAIRREMGDRVQGQLICSGGGTHNATLMNQLAKALPELELRSSQDYGVHEDAKEALLMASLAWAHQHKIPANLPEVTGASHATVLGSRSGA